MDLLSACLVHSRTLFGTGLYQGVKFRLNQCTSFYNMQVSIFCELGLKMAINVPEWVFGEFVCQMRSSLIATPIRHLLVQRHVILIIRRVHRSVPYMGALAVAGCAWSARGDPGYGGKWAGLARRGRCTPCSWAQREVRVHWGLSQQACASTGGFLTLQLLVDCHNCSIGACLVRAKE